MSTTSTSTNHTGRPTLKELMFRSTIYNRHEARRAKTLLRQGDPRPALVRVLAPAGAAAAIAAVEKKSTMSTTSMNAMTTAPHPVTMEDDTVFALHDTLGATETNQVSVSTSQSVMHPSVSTSAIAAAAGAVFSEALYGTRCLRQASPFANAATFARIVSGPAHVVSVHPEHAALTVQHTWRSVPSPSSSSRMFGGNVSYAQLARRAAPVAVLFGTKAWGEHVLQTGHDPHQAPPPPAAISLLAGTTAGTVLGSMRAVLTAPSAAATVMGREVAGATLYFSLYDGVRYLLVRNNDDKALHPVATAMAGALAGVVYDSVRVHRQFLPLTATAATTTTTHSLATVVVRSAPSHALLFLGYESTRRLVQG